MSPTAERRTIGRRFAVPMIGLGAVFCASVEFVQVRWPDLAALPGAVGALSAVLGVLLLFRSQERARNETETCIRISPYVPEMADGSNGAEKLKVVLTPSPQPVIAANFKREPVPDDTNEAPKMAQPRDGTSEILQCQKSGRVVTALRIGTDWVQDVHLSGPAQARLEADPFVQRLARLG